MSPSNAEPTHAGERCRRGRRRRFKVGRSFCTVVRSRLIAVVLVVIVGCSNGAPVSRFAACLSVDATQMSSNSAIRRSRPPASGQPQERRVPPGDSAQLDSPETARKAVSADAAAAERRLRRRLQKSPPPAESVTVVPSPVGPESWATFRNGNQPARHRQDDAAGEARSLVAILHVRRRRRLLRPSSETRSMFPASTASWSASIARRAKDNGRTARSKARIRTISLPASRRPRPSRTRSSISGDEDGMMHAVDRRTGKAKWKFRTGAEIAGSVALFGDKLVFGSHDSFLYCLKAADHSLVWKPFQTENFINCSTAIEADNTFIAGCDTKVRVINLVSGKQVSEVPLGRRGVSDRLTRRAGGHPLRRHARRPRGRRRLAETEDRVDVHRSEPPARIPLVRPP